MFTTQLSSWLLSTRLISGPVPWVVGILAVLALAAMLVTRRRKRWLPIAAVVLVLGFGLGEFLCWLLSDRLNLFGVNLSLASRLWVGVGIAGFCLGIARAIFSRWRLTAAGIACALVLALAGGLGLNADLGEFPNLRNLLGLKPFGELSLTPDAAMPSDGRVGYVTIPATTSHFVARQALVYLPPAALTAHPTRLPVIMLMSGQPGQPSDLFVKGGLAGYLNAWARAHHGRAPIVVVPDQLGAPNDNPMCLNSPLGHSATYLTQDVPRWITAHLPVLSGAANWAVGGFSQGGTCSIQFGAGQPGLFGNILDISGEVAPKTGSLQQTIVTGFGSSVAAYDAALPATFLKDHAPYADSFALFAVGAGDTRYGPGLRTIASDATAAGMKTRLFVSAGTAHDWRTVHYAFSEMIPAIAKHWRLDG